MHAEEGWGLSDYVQVLRRRRRWFVAVLLAVLLPGLALKATSTPEYEATALVAVEPAETRSELERVLFGGADLGTQREIAVSLPLVRDVLSGNGLPSSDSDARNFVNSDVEVTIVPETTVLKITVSRADPEVAADLAQGLALRYLQYLSEDADRRLAEAVRDLAAQERTTRSELRAVQAQLAAGVGSSTASLEEERDELFAQLRFIATRVVELQTTEALRRRGEVIEPASPPTDDASLPSFVLLALLLGLGSVLGLAAAFTRQFTDTRIRHANDVEDATGLPCLATLSDSGSKSWGSSDSRADVRGPELRSFGSLVIAARADDHAVRGERAAIVFMPLAEHDDADSVAVSLGAGLARAGSRVLLLDADVVQRKASDRLGLSGIGLANYLSDERLAAPQPVACSSGCFVVGAGDLNPAALEALPSRRMRDLVVKYRASFEDVLLVTASLSECPEALAVAARTGRIVLVMRTGARRRDVREAVSKLQTAGADISGVVLLGGRSRREAVRRREQRRLPAAPGPRVAA